MAMADPLVPEQPAWQLSDPPLMHPMISPGDLNHLILSDHVDHPEDFVTFHRYNSEDIIYEAPRRKAKIIAEKYLKGDLLGEGSYSKVREMLDVNRLCRRAVKIMKQKRLRKIPNGEVNVQREIKILQKLHHKNVIQLIETFEDPEKQKLYPDMAICT